MIKRLILTALVLGISLSLFSQVNPDTLPERYVPKVIIEAKWGDGPGEFGIEMDTIIPGASVGPCGLIVNNKRIFILDPVNRRIEIYLNNGDFQKMIDLQNLDKSIFNPGFNTFNKDKEGNFYLVAYEGASGGSKILKYDSLGRFVKELCKSPVDKKFTPIIKRKEPLRIPFRPFLEVKGNSLIVSLYEGRDYYLYIDKNSGEILKKEATFRERRKWRYFGDYPNEIKNCMSLSKNLEKFVWSSRHNVSVTWAFDFDKEGNFYELLWSHQFLDEGVKVIRWEVEK